MTLTSRGASQAEETPPPAVRPPVANRPRVRRRRRRELVWYGFVLPPFVLLVLFVLYPTFDSFHLSFFKATDDGGERFVGLQQYERLSDDSVFLESLLNTVLLAAAFLLLVIPLAVVLASLLNTLRRGATPLKVIYFLPQMTSSVAVAIMFNYVLQPDWGLLNGGLHAFGVDAQPLWLADPTYSWTGSRAAVTLLAVWTGLGYFALITLTGLQSISPELYEAAQLDGANTFRTWWHITLPGLRPILVFLGLTGTIDSMSRFADLWTLGGPDGAPDRSLISVVMYIFRTGYVSADFYLASTVAVVFFLILLVITVIAYRVFIRDEFKAR